MATAKTRTKKKITLLEKDVVKRIGDIPFVPVVTVAGGYRLMNTSFPKGTLGTTSVLKTKNDNFYIALHYLITKMPDGKPGVILPDGNVISIFDGGVNEIFNEAFGVKDNLRALKNARKIHLYARKNFPNSNVATMIVFTVLKPVSYTLVIKKKGLPHPDLLYTVKDRDAIEEAGIVIGAGLDAVEKDVAKEPADVKSAVKTAIRQTQNLQRVYGLTIGNFKQVGRTHVISTPFEDAFVKKMLGLAKRIKDPMMNDLTVAFLKDYPAVARNSGVELPPSLAFLFEYNIPLGGRKGEVRVSVIEDIGRPFDFKIPNPNPNGRKPYISVRSVLFYPIQNKYIVHKHSKTKQRVKFDVLSLSFLY